MAKKNNKKITITFGSIIGLISIVIYYKLYGTELLIKLLLGSIIFVSFTSVVILGIYNKIKNKKIYK